MNSRSILHVVLVFVVSAFAPIGCKEAEPPAPAKTDLSQKTAELSAHIPFGTSLLGKQLMAPELDPDEHRKRQAAYDQVRAKFNDDPENEHNIIWLGRRAAYLGLYAEAIRVFSEGFEFFPDSIKDAVNLDTET